MNAQLSLYLLFVFYVAKQKSTAAPGKETTAVPAGKTTNNTEKEDKDYFIEISCFFFNVLLVDYGIFS